MQDLLMLSNSVESTSIVKECEATKAANLVIWCILTSDDTDPENYRPSENQTPDLYHCGYNKNYKKW